AVHPEGGSSGRPALSPHTGHPGHKGRYAQDCTRSRPSGVVAPPCGEWPRSVVAPGQPTWNTHTRAHPTAVSRINSFHA
ncbi:MAG: hypothetical protein RQ982_04970, partial [Gammaproteobacteria bacterium]|nr:hypothetical protein [Gammaproteobacteria bacterium]